MELAHRVLAYVAVAAVAVGIVWALGLVLSRRRAGRLFDRLQFALVGLIVFDGLVGGALLASGGRPREDLHLLYGVIAVALLPLARSFVPQIDRRRTIAVTLALGVLAVVLFRLFTTG